MQLPILERLKEGEKFDFTTLAENPDQTEDFWNWWWLHRAPDSGISRPEIIRDEDPILVDTSSKPTVDLGLYPDFFDRVLLKTIENNSIRFAQMPRDQYRDLAIRIITGHSRILPGQPQIVFAGGGYGSGKTTLLNRLAKLQAIPLSLGNLVGVDVFKILIPEFHLIKAVADGRASFTVQKECQGLAMELFEHLVDSHRSFIWDSSMSDKAATMDRIQLAHQQGYGLTFIGLYTPYEVAVRQAMYRAKVSRRFPHPAALPASHTGFRDAFDEYLPLFEEAKIFANFGAGPDDCFVIAEKTGRGNDLAILDEEMFSLARSH